VESKIFDDYGIEIIQRSERYFLRVDSGEMASRLIETEISIDDASIAQKSPQNAYDIIIKYDKAGSFRNV